MSIEERLREIGIEIPTPPRPLAAYVPGVVAGRLVYTSGQLPVAGGELRFQGKLGSDIGVEEGAKAARQAVLNCLGVVKSLVGSLDRVERVIKLNGYIQSAEDFYDQARVLDGASELLQQVFGEKGRHARAAIGVNSLPANATCEVELIVELSS